MSKDPAKTKALESALAQIDKKYGKGTVMRLGDAPGDLDISVIPTGVLELDIALGVGGIPRGRIIEVFGPESSGKTTLALHMIAATQKEGGAAAFVDVEHALDPSYAKALDVDTDNLYVSQPGTGEEALEIVEALVSSGGLDMIVIDSVAALVPKAEIDGLMGDSQVGLQARLMSKAMRKLAGVINKTGTIAVFINQLREKVGVMFGSPEVTSGGRALKFYSTVRLDIRRIGQIKVGDDVIGNKVRIKVVKNKVAPPFKNAEAEMYYGEGISRTASILNMGTELDIIGKSGAWYSYNDEQIGQGRENARQYLKDNPDILEEIKEKVYKSYNIGKYATIDDEEKQDEEEEK